jgi:hypothetical protein
MAIRAIERQHEESIRMWRTHTTVQDAIKAQIVQAINPIWIETLNNRYTGYAGVTMRDLLNHLYDRYGAITAHDLEENDKHFRHEYDPSQPIETLYKQLDDAMLYADAGHQAYTAIQITNNAYNLVARTGLFKRACREWRARDPADKTWSNFKIAFTAAWLENQEDELITTQGQGYHPATIASLVATTQDLTTQLATKDTVIADLRRQLQARPTSARADQGGNIPDNTNYCWTHGWVVANDHTSASCTRQRQGHKSTATRADTMGGNDRGKARVKA